MNLDDYNPPTPMHSPLSILALLGASAIGCAACADKSDVSDTRATAEGNRPTPATSTVMQTTTPVPTEYFAPAARQGTVEVIRYDSKDYTRADRPATRKPAYVYLPPGYDAAERYDIIYLLHGWTGTAEQYFGLPGMPQMKHLFDNLIARGRCRPFIAVSPTWDKDNRAKDWGESTREAAVFSEEFIGELIPAVESRYSTYAATTDRAGILASRAHRAVGGFSLGAITTWHIFEQAFPYCRLYLPMSGDNWHVEMFGGASRPRETGAFLADLVKASDYRDDFYVWYAVGSEDVRIAQTHNQALAMMAHPDVFNPRTFSYHQKPGGRHDHNAVWEFLYHALPTFFPMNNDPRPATAFTRTSRIADVISDPAFSGYGRLLFPADDGYWGGETLEQLRLTWYTHIDPDKTVEVANYLRSEAAAGRQIFYDLYTEAERSAEPRRRNTGLFFFRGRPGAPFAVCNAGGGFAYVGAMHDSYPHALELSKRGLNAFALVYRPGAETAMEDLARALTFIIDHAAELGVRRDGYALWGGSAGARMAATLGNADALRRLTGRTDLPRAAAVVMQYTGYTPVSPADAPTYACVGTADGIASWRTMQSRLERLRSLGIPTEFHSYEGLPHGFGLGRGTVADGWLNDAVRFWQSHISGATGDVVVPPRTSSMGKR